MRSHAQVGSPRPPAARLVRTGVIGLVCALGVLAAGFVAERIVFGRSDDDARRRVEADLQQTFDALALELRQVARSVSDVGDVQAAAGGDVGAARRLFDAAAAGPAGQDPGTLAVTAYDLDGTPIAWAGRPSDLPGERLRESEAWLITQSTLGFRLVYVSPVVAAPGRRVGAVAAERAIDAIPDRTGFRFPARLAPVTIALPSDSPAGSLAFVVPAPSGAPLLTAEVTDADLAGARLRWRRASISMTAVVLAVTVLFAIGSLLERRRQVTTMASHAAIVALIVMAVVLTRLLLWQASIADWWSAPLFSGSTYASTLLRPLLSSPFDFLVTACSAAGLVAVFLTSAEVWRVARRRRRRGVAGPDVVAFVAAQLVGGVVVAILLAAYENLLRDTIASTALDLLHFSLHPWTTSSVAPRLAMQIGLIIWHATVLGAGVLVLRTVAAHWSPPRRWAIRASILVVWMVPTLVWRAQDLLRAPLPILVPLTVMAVTALLASRITARYRRGSQAFRLVLMTLGLVVPALAFYPTIAQLGFQAKQRLVETRYAPQARDQRQTIQTLLRRSLDEIDRLESLQSLVVPTQNIDAGDVVTDRAFAVWRVTSLAAYPVTSSVELYGAAGALVSRFAFNLPDDLTAVPRSEERSCGWDVYEEVAPFFAEERRVLHAGRAICGADGAALGSIVVHAILDYENLPFIASQSPYVQLLRPTDPLGGEDLSGEDVEYAVYGWSRTPFYSSSGRAWSLDDAVFERVQAARAPLWVELERTDDRFDAYVLNDRFGIYALGIPVVAPLDHLVNLAELIVLACGTYLLLLPLAAALGVFSRKGTGVRALLREVRESFYRKLFLAFVAATVVPVAALALATSNYVANEMRSNVEDEAVRTALAARRVVEDLVAPRASPQGVDVDDNLLVWVSRLIDQDVNVFQGPHLLATSERNLFASGLLPMRTPAQVHRDIGLQREAATVMREQVGALEYLVSATAMTAPQLDAVVTVPLTSRQQEIESRIDTLNRRVLLGALLFVFCGAGLGYWLAERIADPVNRLSRATRRLARGDLDTRVMVSSSDELRRLVHDFNQMAAELQRQAAELQRTHRLEAWAEMARQVAHEIKNPLTPIQLNAEHLRRVHADLGEPMTPVLQDCVNHILTQVALLRRIASEFSNFASSPTVKRSRVDVASLLGEVVDPYRVGLGDRIRFDVNVSSGLPDVHLDRGLLSRALVNIVENALHSMPGDGTLTVRVGSDGEFVRIEVGDTGGGMDAEALSRAFEPYFSTKAGGTGLGLPIAKRNIELCGGSVAIRSERGKGTIVEVGIPALRPADRTT